MISIRRTALVAALLGTTAAAALAAGPAQAADPYSAFVFSLSSSEPTIYSFINAATSSLNMTMYELNDTTAVNDLIAREKAGVTVRVILDQAEKSTNQTAYNNLKAGGVGVVWSYTKYTYTHQKTITINNDESLVLTGNLTSEYYSTTRDYGVFDTDAADVSAITTVFNDDYKHSTVTPSDGDNLLWSPTTAQSRLVSFVNGATKTLDIEEEEFSDSAVVKAIVARAKAGVKVRIVLEDPADYSSEVTSVENAGGTVVGYDSPTGFYMHAKVMVADYGLSTASVEVGSMNDTSNSLGSNRELGIILNDSGVESTVENAFVSDFNGGASAK
ncbi:MAG TPA: phospholipase D-like domain-containing protein [Actinocrinis sp.]|nr:phospholipase D-like domain-containing protein [Actinocrinis sp.]